MNFKEIKTRIEKPFIVDHHLEIRLLVIFLIINGLVLVNAVIHDPRIGYDALDHLEYIKAFSDFQLVTPEQSREFFSPPLPYALPALVLGFTGLKIFWIGKIAQLLNFFLSLGATYFLIKLCREIFRKKSLPFHTLLFLGILPVYYKTFSQVRGETYLVFFALLSVYYLLKMVIHRDYTVRTLVLLGMSMSLCALSRQWGIFLFPGIFLLLAIHWIRFPRRRKQTALSLIFVLLIVLIFSGWFYASLQIRYGSVRAFNRGGRPQFAFRNQSLDFYTELKIPELFTVPVRPHFPNHFFPIFYSEIWGDYWGYFTLYGYDSSSSEYINGYYIQEYIEEPQEGERITTNYQEIQNYLGRVNLVSLLPSLLALGAMIWTVLDLLPGRQEVWRFSANQESRGFLLFSIWAVMVGYMWFLIMYPNLGKGDTIKATYALHVFPFLAILVGEFLARIKNISNPLYWIVLASLGLVFLHNLPASLSHFHFFRLL